MKKTLAFLLCAAAAGTLCAGTVVMAPDATPAEKAACKDLNKYYTQVVGKGIYDSSTPLKVYLGKGSQKAAWYKAPADLKFEEWHIASNGNELVINGDVRGTVWGVYEFIEKYLGCRFLANDTEIVPANPAWQLPKIDERFKPAFIRREMSSGTPRLNYVDFRMKRKESVRNRYGEISMHFGSPHGCHTFGKYIAAFPKGTKYKPAVGSTNSPCYSDAATRKAFAEQLKRFIEKDRKGVKKEYWRFIYSVDQNDGYGNNCKCADCRKYPTPADANIDFVNSIAETIEKDYPEILVQTFAYQHTQQPAKIHKARKNVIVRSCNSEICAPLLPGSKQGELLEGWKKMAQHLAIWAYWKPYSGEETAYIKPRKVMQAEIQYCRDSGVKTYYAENERPYIRNFWPLQYYLWSNLMINPDCDIEKLSEDFFNGYYGAAAPAMKQYCEYLEKRMLALPQQTRTNPYGIMDKEFFETADKFLDAAEKAAAGDERSLKHVRWERIPVDHARLLRQDKYPLGKDKDMVIKRWHDNASMVYKTFTTDRQWRKDVLKNALADLENEVRLFKAMPFEIPEQFKGKKIQDFHWPDFDPWGGHKRYLVDDPEASSGRAFTLQKGSQKVDGVKHKAFHEQPLQISIYDSTAPRTPKDLRFAASYEWKEGDYASDEKYHWYKLADAVVTANMRIVFHWSWRCRVYLRKGVTGIDQNFPKEIWASIKITGPSYVKGSTKPDGIFIDRVVLVEKPR